MALLNDHRRVNVLFAHRRSAYWDMPVEVFDERRDARSWKLNEGGPLIVHPPCRSWCRMSHLAKPPAGESELAFFALAAVRLRGGVLEHPAHSKFWPAAGLPRPGGKDEHGWTLAVSQRWWGHRAEKPTWLYIVGCAPGGIPELPLSFTPASHVCGSATAQRMRGMDDDERDLSPPAFAWWLEELASRCARPPGYLNPELVAELNNRRHSSLNGPGSKLNSAGSPRGVPE